MIPAAQPATIITTEVAEPTAVRRTVDNHFKGSLMVDHLDSLIKALEAKQTVVQATVIGPDSLVTGVLGRKLLVSKNGAVDGSLGAISLDSRVVADCLRAMEKPSFARKLSYALSTGESEALGLEPGLKLQVFVEALHPSETLLIVGAGHIAQPLSKIGKLLGLEVAIIDDRWSFANRQRFPEADYVIAGYYDEELARFPITSSTYIVLVTRGHTHDEASLRQVISSDAAYIGMIGSKRRVGAVLRHLVEEGIPQELTERVFTPIGLDIGAETPEEIAVCILAEVINVRRRGTRHPASLSSHAKAKGGAEGC